MKKRIISFITAIVTAAFALSFAAFADFNSPADVQPVIDEIIAFELKKNGASDVQDWINGNLTRNAGKSSEWYAVILSVSGKYDMSGYADALEKYIAENKISSSTSRMKCAIALLASGRGGKLSESSLFPIDEVFSDEPNLLDAKTFVENVDRFYLNNGGLQKPETSDVGAAKKFLPTTWKKLTSGEEVRILAWGDSVTACGFLPDDQRWQVKFVDRLQKMFPNAKITLLTEAWGGRSSDSYRNEPEGSPKNYKEKVLAVKPDLIVSEFVNDAYMDAPTAVQKYGEMKKDFEANGMEWIILGPHYVRPDWMGLTSERDVDEDPRPLVKGLREFTAVNNVPFADTPILYGKLWRSGIPYNTLMTNNINHPNAFGMELFAAALARLFEE